MKIDFKNKKNLVIGGLILVIILLVVLGLRRGKSQETMQGQIPTSAVIPTVDSSVIVELKELKKSVATLTIKNAPPGTKEIEYLVAYDAEPGAAFSEEVEGLDVVPQGFQGNCRNSNNIWECGNEEPIAPNQRVIVFGSSSSGVYRFHTIIGKVKVTLNFSGNYGAKAFEKEYEL